MGEDQNDTRQVVISIGNTRLGMSVRAAELVTLKRLITGATDVVGDAGPVTSEELDTLLSRLQAREPRFFPVEIPRKTKTREAQWKAERNFTRPNKPPGRS